MFLNEIVHLQSQPDIIVLTEIWVGGDEINYYSIDVYKMFYHCNDNYRAGGVLVYVMDRLVCSDVAILSEVRSTDCLLITILAAGLRVTLLLFIDFISILFNI